MTKDDKKGLRVKIMNDEKSKELREPIQKRPHWDQLGHFWGKWTVDG